MTLSDGFSEHSAEWREIKELLTGRKEALVEQLISTNCDEVRGRIKQIDEILSLSKQTDEEAIPSIRY